MRCLFRLGKFRAEQDGAPCLTLPGRVQGQELLQRLALRADHELHTQQAMDVGWPDLDAMVARDNPCSTPSAAA